MQMKKDSKKRQHHNPMLPFKNQFNQKKQTSERTYLTNKHLQN
jgi:hypothetical protein